MIIIIWPYPAIKAGNQDESTATTATTYFVATDGFDASDRGSKKEPWRTISYALKRIKPGDTLFIRGGVYFEHDLEIHLSGTASDPVVIQGYSDEKVVIDGGFPTFRNIGNEEWELFDPKIEEWRSKSAVDPGSKNEKVFGFILNIPDYANERVRLVPYKDPKNLRSTHEAHAVDAKDSSHLYVGPGVWRNPNSGRLHIRLVNNITPIPSVRDPRKISLHLSTAYRVLDIYNSTYLTVRNLTLQNADQAIRLRGINHHLLFDGITTWALVGIYAPGKKRQEISPENSFITVSRSHIYSDVPKWIYWSDVKSAPKAARLLQTGAINMYAGSHDWDIGWNHFRGGFDGPSQNENAHHIKYHHNQVEGYADDGFELEGDCVNAEVYENYIFQTYTAVAMSPCLIGPVYIYRNVIANLDKYRFRRPNIELYHSTRTNQVGAPFKFTEYQKTGARPKIAVHQNTIIFLGHESRRKDRGFSWINHESPYGYQAFNNIGYVVNGVAAADYGAPNLGQQIDGNLYFKANKTDGANLLSEIAGTRFSSLGAFHTSAAFRESKTSYSPGWEANGHEGDPLFSGFKPNWNKSSNYWKTTKPFITWPVEAFSLQTDSPARHAGVELPVGLPDTQRPPSGIRPDIGAIVYDEKFPVGPHAVSHKFADP